MEARNFEYAALRAMADKIFDMVVYTSLNIAHQHLRDNGLDYTETDDGVVVYPARSTRKNPACVLISNRYCLTGFSACKYRDGKMIYIYKAGDYDVAGGCEKA